MSGNGKKILILGGGVGGLTAANELRKKLGSQHSITVVDRNTEFTSYSSLLWTITGMRKPEQIKKDITRLVSGGIEIINKNINSINTDDKTVRAGEKDIPYDYLIISLGADLAPEKLDGLTEAFSTNAYNLYDTEGAIKIKNALKDFTGGKITVLVCSMPFKCPAAPYETTLLVKEILSKKGVSDAVISLYTPEGLPMGVAGADVGNMVKAMLVDEGIEPHFGHAVTSINPDSKEIVFDKGKADYDMLIVVPPHKAPDTVSACGFSEPGWIPVDKNTFETKIENVYAIGDIASIKLPGEWKEGVPIMLPKAGVFAHYEAKVLAENLANEISGRSERVEYTGEGGCFIETGDGKAGFGSGNFYATPNPKIKMHQPSKSWHMGKIMFEKFWLSESVLKGPVDSMLESTIYGNYKKRSGN